MAEKKRFMDDFEEYEVTEEHHPSKLGTVIRFIFYGLILLVNAAILFRVCMGGDPASVKKLTINDTLRAAYTASPDDFTVYTQTVYDMYTEDGIYYATGMFFVPKAGQLQVSIRYNVRTADDAITGTSINETFSTLLSDSGLLPPSPLSGAVLRRGATVHLSFDQSELRDSDYFAFRLCDDEGNYYLVSNDEKSTRLLYVYHKLTFDGIPSNESNLYVEIYASYKGIPDYSTVLGRMKVYSNERALDEYRLSGNQKNDLTVTK